MTTQNKPAGTLNEPESMKKNPPLQQPGKSQDNQSRDEEEEDPQHYIDMLEEHQIICEREGRYVEAEMAKNKLVELRKQLEVQRKEEIKSRHMNEKRQLEQEHIEEFKEFNAFWDQKMAEFNEQARSIEEQTMIKHQTEMAKFLEELDMSLPNRPKDSPELLNLRKIQQNLAKKKEYIEAHKVQQRCMKLEKEELERWLPTRDKKILNQKAQLEQKQANELNALRKRIATGQDEQRKARSLELERLLQKYQNIRKELEAQQQLELVRISSSKAMNTTGSTFRPQGSRMGGRSNYDTGSPAYGTLDNSTRKK